MEDFTGKYHKQFNYIVSNYEFRFNIVTSQYEYRNIEFVGRSKKTRLNTIWKKYDDRVKNFILLKLMEADLDISQDKFNIFVESEKISPDYNPFIEYFENLDPWDEKTDYIDEISKTVQTTDTDHFRSTLQRFFVGTIECLLEDDAVNDVCLVFQSGQGIGKTRWMRSLLPKKFQSEYLYEGNIDTKNKDHTMYLSQYWFIHLDELETLKSNDISAIKSYITRQRISLRKAFGRYKSHFVRRASFLGSVNDDKFLTDITGNRRWLVFKVFNINYEHKVNVDGLWSQVYFLWKSGYKHWFDIDEIKVINKVNEQFRSMSYEEEICLMYLGFPTDETAGEFATSTEVLNYFGEVSPKTISKINSRNIGRALAKYSKFKKIKNGVSKYFIFYKGAEIGQDTELNDGDNINIETLKGEDFGERKAIIEEEEVVTIEPKNDFEVEDDMPF